ncbi:MAG: hypothetical protein COB23_04335 [Methylophaga sp.]|nr:MAG: hypothetical protein COB23_04335 [Methylophaga sp.]
MRNLSSHSCYRLDQLAHLGLPSQIFIPALLQELHHEISSFSNTFFWQDDKGKLCNIFDEIAQTKSIQNFITSISSIKEDKYLYTTKWVSSLAAPTTSLENFGKCPFVAEFYKTILLPMGYYNTCFIPIFNPKTNVRLGILMVHRTKYDPDFSQEEIERLQYISSIIFFGMSQPKQESICTTDGWEQGLLIIDHDGKIQHACAMGEKLLSLASSSFFDSSVHHRLDDIHVFDGIDKLIKALLERHQHQQQIKDPTLTQSNAWGDFKLRAFLIKDKIGNRMPRIGLNIRWQEPFVLKLFHRIKTLGLTPRQETVGLLYAAGDPHQNISAKLNISVFTVKEHVKNITDKLNIRSRADLIALLLCDNSS